jgi:hypothetical protein
MQDEPNTSDKRKDLVKNNVTPAPAVTEDP